MCTLDIWRNQCQSVNVLLYIYRLQGYRNYYLMQVHYYSAIYKVYMDVYFIM